MTVYLVVYLLLSNDGWTPGWEISGWHPRAQPSMEVCLERRDYAQKKKPPDGILKWAWVCKTTK